MWDVASRWNSFWVTLESWRSRGVRAGVQMTCQEIQSESFLFFSFYMLFYMLLVYVFACVFVCLTAFEFQLCYLSFQTVQGNQRRVVDAG